LSDPKWERLKGILRPLESALVAFSGGVDSTLLLKACCEVLGNNVMAVTAQSPIHPSFELEEARRLARRMGVRHVVLDASDLLDDGFMSNPPDRCYHCKKALLKRLKLLARENGIKHVVEGGNADDTGDFRPGMKAVREMHVLSPLKEAGLTKADVRRLSKKLGLPTWNKPSYACLASRFPYGQRISTEALARVEQAERYLMRLGLSQVRVRDHGAIARIEVPAGQIERLVGANMRKRIARRLRRLGYAYVTVDIEGYRMGSMNEPLRAVRRSAGKGRQ